MGGDQRPHLNGRLEGGVSKGDPSAACCSRTRDTSLGLITLLSPFCLRGSASMLSSCGYQGLAALCHLCFCAVVNDHCLPPLFCNCYSFHLFRFIRHNRHIVSELRCCRSDRGTPPDLWACQQLGISHQRQFIHYLSIVKYSGRNLRNDSLSAAIKCHNRKMENPRKYNWCLSELASSGQFGQWCKSFAHVIIDHQTSDLWGGTHKKREKYSISLKFSSFNANTSGHRSS